ncbi:hybrid sensor histidine kinase/response regulator [Aquimarina rhabdastrellae]
MSIDGKLHFNQRIQLITLSHDGIITTTDNNLFSWKKGSSIYDAHPFFEILRGFLLDDENTITEYSFPCIHLEENNLERICDVTIKLDLSEIIIMLFDYTQKYNELNQIAQQKNESILKSRELELKNEYLVEKENFKNNFIANINHEIRTPLTGIMGFIEVLEKTKLSFEQEELVRIIKRESKHLGALIEDMVDISKIEAGQLNIIHERFKFHDLIKGFKETYTKIAEKKGIEFEMYVDPNIQESLISDKTRLHQILNNILNNAFKFTDEGKVSFTIAKNYQRTNKLSINFKISDTGVGIPEKSIPKVFERFTRLQNDQRRSGTGLGLAIVKSLVEALQGDIKVTSIVNEGTTFSINLPFQFDILKTATPKPKKKKKFKLPTSDQKFKVLLVDDEEVNQYLVMKILINHGSFYVDVAMNGEQAIKYVEKRFYDVILMDIKMTVMDGYKTTHIIRNHYGDKEIADVPIIGFTAKATEAERDKCLKAGMDDFIGKPFEQDDLLNKIAKHLQKKTAQ